MGVHFIDRLWFGKPTAAAAVPASFPSPPAPPLALSGVGANGKRREEKGGGGVLKRRRRNGGGRGPIGPPQVTKSQKSAPCRPVPSLLFFPLKSQSRKLENSPYATGKSAA